MAQLWLDKYRDSMHEIALKSGIAIFSKLISSSKFSKLKPHLVFTGGTSLMFKYGSAFARFSKDLDFSLSVKAKGMQGLATELFETLKDELEEEM